MELLSDFWGATMVVGDQQENLCTLPECELKKNKRLSHGQPGYNFKLSITSLANVTALERWVLATDLWLSTGQLHHYFWLSGFFFLFCFVLFFCPRQTDNCYFACSVLHVLSLYTWPSLVCLLLVSLKGTFKWKQRYTLSNLSASRCTI